MTFFSWEHMTIKFTHQISVFAISSIEISAP